MKNRLQMNCIIILASMLYNSPLVIVQEKTVPAECTGNALLKLF